MYFLRRKYLVNIEVKIFVLSRIYTTPVQHRHMKIYKKKTVKSLFIKQYPILFVCGLQFKSLKDTLQIVFIESKF